MRQENRIGERDSIDSDHEPRRHNLRQLNINSPLFRVLPLCSRIGVKHAMMEQLQAGFQAVVVVELDKCEAFGFVCFGVCAVANGGWVEGGEVGGQGGGGGVVGEVA